MIYRIIISALIITTLVSCNQNGASKTNDTKETVQTGRLLSTVYQVLPSVEAEIQLDSASGGLTVLVNDDKCDNELHVPEIRDIQIYEINIEVDDYNFDGIKDFALVLDKEGSKFYYVNVFDTNINDFVPLEVLTNLVVDVENKELVEYIRNTDLEKLVFKHFVTPNNELGTIARISEHAYTLYQNIDNGPIGNLAVVRDGRWFNHSAMEVKKMELLSAEGMPATYVTKGKRLYLYNSPKTSGKTSMYLVEGDKMELLDIVEGFFKIKFVNPKYGDIVKWIKYSNGNEL